MMISKAALIGGSMIIGGVSFAAGVLFQYHRDKKVINEIINMDSDLDDFDAILDGMTDDKSDE